jgi:predicted esterase
MVPRVLCFLFALCFHSFSYAQGLHFGTNRITPGEILRFAAPVTEQARAEIARTGKAPVATGALVLPPGYTNLSKPCALLIISVPSGGSAISRLASVTNVGLPQGWAMLAADGPKMEFDQDTIQVGYAVLGSVLNHLARTWPITRQWPVACAGFSGGAKRSAAVAGAMTRDGWKVIGVFMGGCNEDRASTALELFHPGPGFLRVPMFLSNGDQDPIANPTHGASVRDSMLRSGFTTIRLESFAGKHQLNKEHLREALDWFQQSAGIRRK